MKSNIMFYQELLSSRLIIAISYFFCAKFTLFVMYEVFGPFFHLNLFSLGIDIIILGKCDLIRSSGTISLNIYIYCLI